MLLDDPSRLGYTPKRIVSVVPSQTELLYYLGLVEETVGITKFCIHPDKWFRNKTRVGGTKNLHAGTIETLKPDLIIANKEENTAEDILQLAENYPVWVSDISNLGDALQMINDVGALTAKGMAAGNLVKSIEQQFNVLKGLDENPVRACYLIWQNPVMVAGGDTFINDMMHYAGLQNVFAPASRYPEVTMEEINNSGCGLLLLSSEPFPFKEKHIESFSHALPGVKVILADGEMFSWYGSRLLQSPDYFMQLRQQYDR